MSAAVTVSVSVDSAEAVAAIRSITRSVSDRQGLHAAIAIDSEEFVRDHLDAKYSHRDADGITFWHDVINRIESSANNAEATVMLQEVGIALRYYGGDVTPGKSISSYTGKPTRALAVPTNKVAVAAGRRVPPKLSGLLAFVRKAQGLRETVGFLVEGQEKTLTRGKNKGTVKIVPKPGGGLLYTLRTITRHREDKGILPPESELQRIALAAIFKFVSLPS